MKRWILLIVALGIVGCSGGSPPPTVQRVVIISIDGLRPDVALRANMPNLRNLCRNGCYSFWARTTEVSVTLPSHVSMLTGVVEGRHDIWWNSSIADEYVYYPSVPTIFEQAKRAGYTTAMAVGKQKLEALSRAGTIDWQYLPADYANDLQVAGEAAKLIKQHQPQVLFVHLPDVDAAGHGSGWGSVTQINAAQKADQAVGIVLAALRRQGLLSTTAVIVTADHGGAGGTHGADDPRSRHIPWIISGPGIKKNVDLTSYRELVINTEDTFATACFLLNITLDEEIDGKPITQALEEIKLPPEEEELLKDVAVR